MIVSNLMNDDPEGLPVLEKLSSSDDQQFLRDPGLNAPISTFAQGRQACSDIARELSSKTIDLSLHYSGLIRQKMIIPAFNINLVFTESPAIAALAYLDVRQLDLSSDPASKVITPPRRPILCEQRLSRTAAKLMDALTANRLHADVLTTNDWIRANFGSSVRLPTLISVQSKGLLTP